MRYTIFIICLLLNTAIVAQNVNEKLDAASSAYASEDLENTRYALQQSLAELDILVGQEILAKLPTELAGNSYDEQSDQTTGSAAGLTGVFVNRTYPGENKTVQVELITDSPLLASLSGMLTNPLFASVAGSGQKSIKVDGYKALLQKDENDPMHYEVQVPIDQSLFSIRYDGFDDEGEVTSIANQIGIREITALLK